ncbi:efflux RND transporter periplasmic adaptor subunit [Pontiellaceae bacterium B12227]|nr:efflux RND transporter periplasmic adaptor subunit [Pontiellaceae bacterium B12227]
MKNVLMVFGLLLAGILVVEAQTCGTGDCECASCLAKKEGGFTLPGLQGLEKQENDHAGHDHDVQAEETFAPHAAAHQHVAGDACCPVAAPAVEPVPHDHDGDGIPDHDLHDDHDDHAGHDHGPVEGIKLTQEMFDKIGIEVREAAGGTVAQSSVFPAEIKLNRDTSASISPRYASIVRAVYAEIGDEVKKGSVLASLENRETMAVYKLTAPNAGVIISKDLAVGEVVGDDKLLFEVADLSSVWADISVFPQYQHLLRKGMPVNFIARDGCVADGQIKYISPIISHETRTFTARCILQDARDDFTPGAFVRAKIKIKSIDAAVVVPREAVQTLDGESVVFVPSPNGFIPEVVALGLSDDRHVEIVSGLEPDEKYVAAGAFTLKAQMVTSGMDPHAGHGH